MARLDWPSRCVTPCFSCSSWFFRCDDSIHIGAAMQPDDVSVVQSQLKVGGRLVTPIDHTGRQGLYQIDRIGEDEFKTTFLLGVRYVPMTDPESQLAAF
eukprot:m.44245 g.44245  ORF g.44245 m.44245 type:complete len:99 (-) comp10826_c0_seq2:267-563(-)